MTIVLSLVMVSFIPKMVMSPMVVLTVLRRVCSAVMTGKGVAIVGTGLPVAVGAAAVILTRAGHSSHQNGEHQRKHDYPHFKPPSISD
jgi:hypothetical protein